MTRPIAHTKQNSEICTHVLDNDVIMLKSEGFRRQHSTLKDCISAGYECNIAKMLLINNC